jgi:uncharacterized protein involved in exopolysaccharide biosynthesis
VRRHKLVAVLPVIVLVGLAVLYSLDRQPVYKAEARQAIGRVDVSQPGALAGFQSATKALASSYSRAIVAPEVVDRVARATKLTRGEVRDRLKATPIPESAVISVRGTGPSEREAIAVATSGARALDAYVAALNRSNPNAHRLFREYTRASGRLSDRRFVLQQAKHDAGSDRSAAANRRIQQLQRDVDEARLTTQVAAENYAISRRSESNVSILQTISLPQSATSDKDTNFQIVLFGAVVAGILLGIALASLLANRRERQLALN